MTDTVQSCPECESSQIKTLSSHVTRRRVNESEWTCKDCGAGFDSPVVRDAISGGTAPPSGSLAETLLNDMDADVIGGATDA